MSEEVVDIDLRKLMQEAGEAGDTLTAAICRVALGESDVQDEPELKDNYEFLCMDKAIEILYKNLKN